MWRSDRDRAACGRESTLNTAASSTHDLIKPGLRGRVWIVPLALIGLLFLGLRFQHNSAYAFSGIKALLLKAACIEFNSAM
jgi:hypothetical protein